MEVEVSEFFGPNKRPTNFIVLKYFLLGMLISNGIESILIVPKTLSMTDENEEQLQKLDVIYQEHDAFKAQLDEYNREFKHLEQREYTEIETISGKGVEEEPHKTGHKGRKPIATLPPPRPKEYEVDTNKLIEITLLIYGILTLALGIFAVFKEHAKLLLVFIGVVALGLVMLFFSGLTLLVFMAVLNDVIIALVAFKYFQMIGAPVDAAYGQAPQDVAVGGYAEPSYNVDLNQPSNYR